MKLKARAALATAFSLLAQCIHSAPSTDVTPDLQATIDRAALSSRQDSDPSVNGTVADERARSSSVIPPSARQAPDPELALSAGWTEYDRCHWDRAFLIFSTLADQGDVKAARIAVGMLKHGRALYGLSFEPSKFRQEAWTRLIEREVVTVSGERNTVGNAAQSDERAER